MECARRRQEEEEHSEELDLDGSGDEDQPPQQQGSPPCRVSSEAGADSQAEEEPARTRSSASPEVNDEAPPEEHPSGPEPVAAPPPGSVQKQVIPHAQRLAFASNLQRRPAASRAAADSVDAPAQGAGSAGAAAAAAARPRLQQQPQEQAQPKRALTKPSESAAPAPQRRRIASVPSPQPGSVQHSQQASQEQGQAQTKGSRRSGHKHNGRTQQQAVTAQQELTEPGSSGHPPEQQQRAAVQSPQPTCQRQPPTPSRPSVFSRLSPGTQPQQHSSRRGGSSSNYSAPRYSVSHQELRERHELGECLRQLSHVLLGGELPQPQFMVHAGSALLQLAGQPPAQPPQLQMVPYQQHAPLPPVPFSQPAGMGMQPAWSHMHPTHAGMQFSASHAQAAQLGAQYAWQQMQAAQAGVHHIPPPASPSEGQSVPMVYLGRMLDITQQALQGTVQACASHQASADAQKHAVHHAAAGKSHH